MSYGLLFIQIQNLNSFSYIIVITEINVDAEVRGEGTELWFDNYSYGHARGKSKEEKDESYEPLLSFRPSPLHAVQG